MNPIVALRLSVTSNWLDGEFNLILRLTCEYTELPLTKWSTAQTDRILFSFQPLVKRLCRVLVPEYTGLRNLNIPDHDG